MVMSGRIEGRAAMALRVEAAEAALIQSVCSRLRDQIAPELVDQGEAFVRQFYHWVPQEDLAERNTRDLCGAAIAVWDFARDRTPGSASVRAYNLGLGEGGWKSANTIVEVVTDDMPFLVSSVEMELFRRGYGIQLSIHPVIDVLRDADGRLAGVFPPGAGMTGALTESLMQFEVDREPEPERLEALVGGIRRVVGDVRAAVEDWPLMRQRLHEIVVGFESAAPPLDRTEVEEVNAFLEWVDGGNFIFLGYREYDLVGEAGEGSLRAVDGSGLGVLRHGGGIVSSSFARLTIEVRAMARSPQPLILTKANSRSTVHRPLYLDYIGVKRFEAGEVRGERRFLGLYTTAIEEVSPRMIPIVRDKGRARHTPGGVPP
jgi:glutamate dehydrogenase